MQYPNYVNGSIKFNYELIPSGTAPTSYKKGTLIFWQGSGEWGPLDGSLISKCYAHEYPKLVADKKFAFPFDILVLQGIASNTVQKIQNWQACEAGLYDLMDRLGIATAAMAGLSQGGQQALKYMYKSMNPNGRITAIAVAGAVQPFGANYPALTDKQRSANDYHVLQDVILDIPLIAVHGDADKSGNGWWAMRNYLIDISSIPGRKNIPFPNNFLTIKGGDHGSSWTQGFNPTTTIGAPVFELIKKYTDTAPQLCATCPFK